MKISNKINFMLIKHCIREYVTRLLVTIILLLLPLLAMPQSKQSNRLYKQGLELMDAEKYEEALPYFQKSDSLDKKKLKPTHKNYYRAELKVADCYQGLAVYNVEMVGNYQEALRLETMAVEIRKRILGEEHPDYASALSYLALATYATGDYTEAIRLGSIALEIQKRVLGEENPDYAESLNNIAGYNDVLGNYAEAIRLGTQAMEIRKKVLGEVHPGYAESLCNLALFYKDFGNYTEAIRLGTQAVEICKKALGEDQPNYGLWLSQLADSYNILGNYPEALRLGTLAVGICKNALGEDHPEYAMELGRLASIYDCNGNYAEAIRLGTQAMKICKKVFGEDHPDYAASLSQLAYYYRAIGNNNEAIRLGTLAMEIHKKALGEEHHEYANDLNNLAIFYEDNGNYAESVRLGTQVMEINKKIFGDEHPNYATSLSRLSCCYFDLGNYAEAIRHATRALEIFKKVFGEGHPRYAISLSQLADLNLVTGNYDAATNYYQQCYRRLNAFVLKTFASMTSKERSDFWKANSSFFTKDLPYAAYKHPDASLTALAYDSQIFSKGLLLNAELEIQKLIEQSHDTTFANRYYKVKQDRAILDDLYQTSPENREINADSLAKVIDREERLLVESSKALGDYTKNLAISWRDVQNNLKDNDLAIEFATVKDTVAKQLIYVAFVLKNGMSAPEIVKLYNTDDFYDIKTKEYYTTPKLYNLVWQPLAEYLKGVKTVYFSPAGHLHTIGIEYLSGDDGKIFAEKYDTYRLSSTRELAITHTINPNRKASTYGGIKYELSPNEWRGLEGVNDSIERSFRDIPQIADNLRGGASGMSYLEGTKIESATIAALLRSANYNVSAFSETAATEESIKMLSGSGIKILHIGTHGFYENEGDMQNAGYKFYTAASQQSNEDRSLSCSGLLFAGANSALDPRRVNEIPEGADDGILTAKEISRLDFSGLDLVVLSACQTGLGEITGEGVFGLQRGFKKAGAQTIVMSLWKVADEPTQLLMVEFFKNLTAGQSKRAAFLAAQQTVRAKYPNPLYWAAFVMVDGN